MLGLLVFAATLLGAVHLSGLARRSVLSTAVLFLGVGMAVGPGALGWVRWGPDDPLLKHLVDVALFSMLFVDGMRVQVGALRRSWRLPALALGVGMPITAVGTAILAHGLAGLSWLSALLLGAILSPTDPVLASAILSHEAVPKRLRRLLNIESGFNDGLALPAVLVLLALVSSMPAPGWAVAREAALGVGLGVAVPWLALTITRMPLDAPTPMYRPLGPMAVGIALFALTQLLHANAFLAAFAAGITLGAVAPEPAEAFRATGDRLAELLKLGAIFVFGALMDPHWLLRLDLGTLAFALLALAAVRPVALAVLRPALSGPEWLTAAWFGPKGFSSALYALMALHAGGPERLEIFHRAALVIGLSILMHASSGVLVARWFEAHAADDEHRSSGDRRRARRFHGSGPATGVGASQGGDPMPYDKNSDLPDSVKDNLPSHAQDIFREAYNSASDEYKQEDTAFKVAWAAVKHEYHKDEDTGRWVEGASDDES